jgi:hypothetical protein
MDSKATVKRVQAAPLLSEKYSIFFSFFFDNTTLEAFRSTSDAQLMALTRHTLPLQSTSALEETSKKAIRSETNVRVSFLSRTMHVHRF